jgi:ribosomal protein L20
LTITQSLRLELTARFNNTGAITDSLLVITGAMGAGKSAVLAEASDILALRHVAHAAIDLDALGLAHLPAAASNNGVMYSNLQSVCKNYASLGVRRIMLARAVEDRTELEFCRDAVSSTNTVVCRLNASLEAMQQRVKMRESGVSQREYVARVANLNVILDRVRLEDFAVTNENRPLTEVALEMLVKAGWISR